MPIRDISCAVLSVLDFLSFLQSPELLILTLLSLPFAWHLTLSKGDCLFSTEVVKNRSPRSSCRAPASPSATSASSILYLPSLTSALFTEAH
jgi:hypothetical protein